MCIEVYQDHVQMLINNDYIFFIWIRKLYAETLKFEISWWVCKLVVFIIN